MIVTFPRNGNGWMLKHLHRIASLHCILTSYSQRRRHPTGHGEHRWLCQRSSRAGGKKQRRWRQSTGTGYTLRISKVDMEHLRGFKWFYLSMFKPKLGKDESQCECCQASMSPSKSGFYSETWAMMGFYLEFTCISSRNLGLCGLGSHLGVAGVGSWLQNLT